MRKRILSLFLALALSIGLAVPAVAAEGGFTDVDPNAYYAEAVAWAVENNITGGTSATTFSPNQTCTRGQIITFLWRYAGSPEPSVTGGVSDIKESDYFYKAVLWAKEKGMFEGDAFQPSEPCTRLMAMEFMWKRLGSPVVEDNLFSDVSSGAVNWAVARGVTSGTGETTFSPEQICTRGQIVTFLHRDATFKATIGTYVHESIPPYHLKLISNESRAEFAFFAAYDDMDIEEASKQPLIYGTLISNSNMMEWSDVHIDLYKEYVVVTFRGELASTKPHWMGKYILQAD